MSWPGLVGSELYDRPVPGASTATLANWRPLSGRFSSSFWLMTVPIDGVVAMRGASAVTVMVSSTAATFIDASTTVVLPMLTSACSMARSLKPLRLKVTL